MAIVEVATVEGGTATTDARGNVRYTQPYHVITDGANNTQTAVLSAAGLPQPQTTYPSDPTARFDGATVRQHPVSRSKWMVDVNYKQPESQEEEEEQENDNPLSFQPIYWLESEVFEEILSEDKSSPVKSIENSAGDQFDEPLVVESFRLVLGVEKNFATLQEIINLNLSHGDKVNDAIYRGGAIRTWLCRPIQCSRPKYHDGSQYYTATFRLAYNPATWDRKIRSTGYRYIFSGFGTATPRFRNATDELGRRVANPIDLDSIGGELGGDPNDDPFYITYQVKDDVSFTTLGV